MEFIEFTATVGVPRPGPYFLYIYFSNTNPLIYVIHQFKICKIYFIMILIRTQQDNSNTTLRLHHYDNRHL